MNKVILMGRLTKDPEIRQAQTGTTIASYSLAVDRGDKDGNTDFINCKAFGKPAEFVQKYLHKGMKILVEGRWQTGSFDGKNGKVYTNDCVVNLHYFCESKGSGSAADTPSATPTQGSAWQYPQSDPAYAPAPQGQTNQGYVPQDFDQISDADLPF
jgi:single-strand DNA-binding protein